MPAASGQVTITLQGQGGYDPILYVLTDCADPSGSCLDKKDAVGGGAKEVITLAVTAGTAVFVVVDAGDGQAAEAGAYTLTVAAP